VAYRGITGYYDLEKRNEVNGLLVMPWLCCIYGGLSLQTESIVLVTLSPYQTNSLQPTSYPDHLGGPIETQQPCAGNLTNAASKGNSISNLVIMVHADVKIHDSLIGCKR